jgi:hypothetical protein
VGRVRTCTLLGPEGPGRPDGCTEPLGPFLVRLAGGGGYRPYFENYTVDASILEARLCLVSQDHVASISVLA